MIHGVTCDTFQVRTDDVGFDYEVRIRCICRKFETAWYPEDSQARTAFQRHMEEVRDGDARSTVV